ncbi:ABC transporter substrate-binding protein [Microvirga brassicacearum]|uniref:ABC transporter substrate-binding protein n=1 Tax=Microvirga brassicacearum TaxID=2580413 RepID=A0A5N3PAT1_9HYPH|nr:ABC transporter substrate-binding protein [Microvirga brassicacearum]KAB0266804.1 ABC transporter substrate-binding protein [Microvirga brassicacearum]
MLTRRGAMGLLGGAGAASIAGGLGVTLPTRSAHAAQNRPTLTIAVDNLKETLAPINGLSTATRRFFPNMFDRLIEQDYLSDENGLTFLPGLATKWEQNGKIWTFQIREGAKFHDGSDVTAEDAAFTLSAERLWGEKPYEPRGKTFTPNFVRVEAIGKYTFEIETDTPDANIPGKLTGFVGFVVPKKYYKEVGVDRFGQMPIGSGPYKVTQFRSGDVLQMEAFDDYWGGPPPAQKLIWKIIPEFAARMAGLVSGEFDFIVNIPTDQEKLIASYESVTLVRRPVGNYTLFAFNTLPNPADNPLVDPKLRYAMVQGVDMDLIVKTLWGDSTFHPSIPFNFPEYGKFYDPSRKDPLPYDPDRSRALIKETKYKGQPLTWNVHKDFYPNYEIAAEIMIDQWREVGINVQANIVDNVSVYRRPFHMLSMSNSSSFIPGDPYQPLWLDWSPQSTRATAPWKVWAPSERFIQLGEAFEKTTTFEDRKRAYLALSEEWQRLTPGMYMWKSVNNFAHRKKLGWVPAGEGEMRLFGDYLKLG